MFRETKTKYTTKSKLHVKMDKEVSLGGRVLAVKLRCNTDNYMLFRAAQWSVVHDYALIITCG